MSAGDIAHLAITGLLAALLFMTGVGKLAGAPSSHAIRDSINVPPIAWKLIGVFELMVVAMLIAGFWFAPLSIAGSIGVVALMIGAIISRVRAGGSQLKSGVTADAVVLLLSIGAVALAFT